MAQFPIIGQSIAIGVDDGGSLEQEGFEGVAIFLDGEILGAEIVGGEEAILRIENSDVTIDDIPAGPDGVIEVILEPGEGTGFGDGGIGGVGVGPVNADQFDIDLGIGRAEFLGDIIQAPKLGAAIASSGSAEIKG